MWYLFSFILGGLSVWAVYHFNLQPKLKAERDELRERLGRLGK